MRFFLDISYDGSAFHGWQVQKNAHTIQAEINSALSTILRTEIECVGSGRTDAGVHAKKQIAHFDADQDIDLEQLKFKLNSLLSFEIGINSILKVNPEAHARFDATSRSYEYHIHQSKDPFLHGRSMYCPNNIDIKAIREGIDILKGWKNFQSFSKVHTDVAHFDCEIFAMEWNGKSNGRHVFSVSANRFLRGMVRALVGTLLEVGQNKINSNELKEILNSKDRSSAGRSVPAKGLFLTEVKYPESIFLS